MAPQHNASAVQPTAQNTWSPQMAAQFNALAPSPMTPQQYLAILLQPMTPSEILISRSPHQGGVNWIFHDQMISRSPHEQSASPSAPQPAATSALAMYQHPTNQMAQQLPNQMAQQAHQMASAGQPMTPTSPQPAIAASPTNMFSPQQTPAVGQQTDLTSKIAEVMREQFGLRPKQQSVMYKTPYPLAYDQIPLPHKYKIPDFTKFSGQGDVSMVEHVNRFILQCGEATNQDPLRVRLFSMSLSGSAFA
jgi:hypothetical protein